MRRASRSHSSPLRWLTVITLALCAAASHSLLVLHLRGIDSDARQAAVAERELRHLRELREELVKQVAALPPPPAAPTPPEPAWIVQPTAEPSEPQPRPETERPVPSLPAEPTAEQVEAWIDEANERLAEVKSLNGRQQDLEPLRRIPRQHLPLLFQARIESRCWAFRSLADDLIPTLVGEGDRELTLAWLKRLPCLIHAVLANHWERDAQATLRTIGGTPIPMAFGLEVLWVRAIGRLGDRDDYPLLADVLVRNHYGYWRRDLYAELTYLPDFPLQDTVERAWATRHQGSGGEAFYPVAAGHGIYAALAGVVEATTVTAPSHLTAQRARAWLTEHSDAPTDPTALTTWLGTAEDPPRFDPATKRWSRTAR